MEWISPNLSVERGSVLYVAGSYPSSQCDFPSRVAEFVLSDSGTNAFSISIPLLFGFLSF